MRNVMHNPVLVLQRRGYELLHICAARRALVLIVKDAAHIRGACRSRSPRWHHVPDGDPAQGVSQGATQNSGAHAKEHPGS